MNAILSCFLQKKKIVLKKKEMQKLNIEKELFEQKAISAFRMAVPNATNKEIKMFQFCLQRPSDDYKLLFGRRGEFSVPSDPIARCTKVATAGESELNYLYYPTATYGPSAASGVAAAQKPFSVYKNTSFGVPSVGYNWKK